MFRNPFNSATMDEDAFLGQFFRPFSFGRIFDDDVFLNFTDNSFAFDP